MKDSLGKTRADIPDLSVEDVLRIGRDWQKSDPWRGATHDTAKLLCDTIERLRATIQEAKDRMRYYFGTFDGKFTSPQMQNVYDVLCRDDE